MATIGVLRGRPLTEPWNLASPKLKTPPLLHASQ